GVGAAYLAVTSSGARRTKRGSSGKRVGPNAPWQPGRPGSSVAQTSQPCQFDRDIGHRSRDHEALRSIIERIRLPSSQLQANLALVESHVMMKANCSRHTPCAVDWHRATAHGV